MKKTVCISHKEDLDGLGSAALVRHATKAEIILTDYLDQIKNLEKIAADKELDTLYICDLGIIKTNKDKFIEILTTLCKRGVSVFYIDHHLLDDVTAQRIITEGVKLVHDTMECATIQVYKFFKKELLRQHAFLAAAAAVTDYMDDTPMASKLIKKNDKQMIHANASMLSYYISANQANYNSLVELCKMLSDGKMANQIPNMLETVKKEMDNALVVMKYVDENYKPMDKIMYCETKFDMNGAVNFIPNIPHETIAVSYHDIDNGFCIVSVRGYVKTHLGKLIRKISVELGGDGGGHPMICGAMIPRKNMKKFLKMFNEKIEI